MHELGIAQDLFKIIKAKAKENNLKTITKIRINIGIASGIDQDLLRHSFKDHIFPDTILRDAELEFTREPVTLKCEKCGIMVNTQAELSTNCSGCGSTHFKLIKGKDVYLQSIEGETAP